MSARPVAASHTRIVPSSLADANRVPSWDHITFHTLWLCPYKMRSDCMVSAAHKRTVPSSPPVATILPSGLNAIELTNPRCDGVSMVHAWTPGIGAGAMVSAVALIRSPGLTDDRFGLILCRNATCRLPT